MPSAFLSAFYFVYLCLTSSFAYIQKCRIQLKKQKAARIQSIRTLPSCNSFQHSCNIITLRLPFLYVILPNIGMKTTTSTGVTHGTLAAYMHKTHFNLQVRKKQGGRRRIVLLSNCRFCVFSFIRDQESKRKKRIKKCVSAFKAQWISYSPTYMLRWNQQTMPPTFDVS